MRKNVLFLGKKFLKTAAALGKKKKIL